MNHSAYTDLSCEDFTMALASKAAVPGGGGAAALAGALGAALGVMVGNLTVGKAKYADVQEKIKGLMAEAESLRQKLIGLVEADATAFEPLSKAYTIPKDDPERPRIMEACLRDACEPPLEMMRAVCRVIELQKDFAQKGSALAVSDAGCGVVFCWAALYAAALNVRVNTRLMTDRAYAEATNAECDDMVQKYWRIAEEVYEDVFRRLQ